MTTVVISQPMFFPWVGLFEQIRTADVYVHYDDVQFSKGGFSNRVQVKTAGGVKWLTVPLADLHLGQKINEVQLNRKKDWRASHLALLRQAYANAPLRDEMLRLVEAVYDQPFQDLASLSVRSMEVVCDYFGLTANRRFLRCSDLGIPGESSRRVLNIVTSLGGGVYVTGQGARNYLDHELFEASGVRVEYLNYRMTPYPQLHGAFTPYVTILDLIANVGRGGASVIASPSVYWREFLK